MREIAVGEPGSVSISEPEGSLEALAAASDTESISVVAARWPLCLAAWAALGEEALGAGAPVAAYAYFRVGYHRGLDRIRGAGWKGQGVVPWSHEPKRGFLRSLKGLGEAAGRIGETDEETRCREFFDRLAPDAP